MTGHPHSAHESFAESLAAYALDILDSPADRAALEAHLAGCAACRDELALQRSALQGIGLGIEPVAPPVALRARALATVREPQLAPIAARDERGAPSARVVTIGAHEKNTRPGPRASASMAWLATAAAVVVAVGSMLYAYALQREVTALTSLAVSAATRADALNAEVVELRRQSSELVQVLNVIGAPDVRLASLSGQGAAAGALGRAYWSRSQGLVFKALQLPGLAANRDYQLWIVPASGAPVSMGVLQVRADGSSSHATPLANLPTAAAIAVTIEPTGGSPTPTMPIVMVGNLVG